MPSGILSFLCSAALAALLVAPALGGPWVYSDNRKVPAGHIQVTTLGSGPPDVRREQAASGFLIELGNGDKFLFDLGTGSYVNLIATGVPAAELTKVFLSHLHSDHHADLASLYVGAMFGRKTPWEVWGPSADNPKHGTAAAIEGLRQFLAWDTHARRAIDLVDREDQGDQVIVHEFDYSKPDQVVYERNGVTITSTPVEHYNTSGPVALRLDWNGLSVVYSGDTRPTDTLRRLAKGADLLILQNMGPILDPAALPYASRLLLNTSHITPQQAGPLLADIRPRLAVLHHLTVNDASRPAIVADVRRGYPEGDLTINEDLDVFDVSAERIVKRKRLVPTRSWGYWHAEQNWDAAEPAEPVSFRVVSK